MSLATIAQAPPSRPRWAAGTILVIAFVSLSLLLPCSSWFGLSNALWITPSASLLIITPFIMVWGAFRLISLIVALVMVITENQWRRFQRRSQRHPHYLACQLGACSR